MSETSGVPATLNRNNMVKISRYRDIEMLSHLNLAVTVGDNNGRSGDRARGLALLGDDSSSEVWAPVLCSPAAAAAGPHILIPLIRQRRIRNIFDRRRSCVWMK